MACANDVYAEVLKQARANRPSWNPDPLTCNDPTGLSAAQYAACDCQGIPVLFKNANLPALAATLVGGIISSLTGQKPPDVTPAGGSYTPPADSQPPKQRSSPSTPGSAGDVTDNSGLIIVAGLAAAYFLFMRKSPAK